MNRKGCRDLGTHVSIESKHLYSQGLRPPMVSGWRGLQLERSGAMRYKLNAPLQTDVAFSGHYFLRCGEK